MNTCILDLQMSFCQIGFTLNLQPLTSLWCHRLVQSLCGYHSRVSGPLSRRKHAKNNQKCTKLNWVCVPMAVELYEAWGEEFQHTFSRLATRPAVKSSVPKPEALSSIYTRINMMLVELMQRPSKQSYSRLIVVLGL